MINWNWKLYKGIFVAVLIVAVAILFLLWRKAETKAKENANGRDVAVAMMGESVSREIFYRNKLGDTVARAKAYELNISNLRALAKSNDLQWLKKFEGLRKDLKNLKSAQSFDLSFDAGEIKSTPISLDSLFGKGELTLDTTKTYPHLLGEARHFQIKDAWNDIDAIVLGEPKLEIRDRLYAVIYSKRPKAWFWKLQWSKREFWAECSNSNKLIKIDSISTIVVHYD